jgi:hypothetical protein
MIEIDLAQIPNQSFSLQLNNVFYQITLRYVINLMTCTIKRNDQVIIENVRCQPNQKIIPYNYLEDGNFAFLTVDNEYPIYTRFNVDQFLVYATQDELEVSRETV